MTGPRSDPPMPMFTTFRMGLPVWPVHPPLRTRVAKSAILSRTACTAGTTFFPSTTKEACLGARRATWRTARSSVTLILSPRNIPSIRAGRPDSPARRTSIPIVSSVTRFFE